VLIQKREAEKRIQGATFLRSRREVRKKGRRKWGAETLMGASKILSANIKERGGGGKTYGRENSGQGAGGRSEGESTAPIGGRGAAVKSFNKN